MIHVFENCLPTKKFLNVYDCLSPQKRPWYLTNFSYIGDSLAWGKNSYPRDRGWDLPLFDAAYIIKLRIMRILRENLRLTRIYVNGQTSDQPAKFHIDYDAYRGEAYTVVLFTTPTWNIQWGGEFVLYDQDTGKYELVPYIPNTAVMINSSHEHFGNSPNSYAEELRTSIAFSYCVGDSIPQL